MMIQKFIGFNFGSTFENEKWEKNFSKQNQTKVTPILEKPF